MSVAPELLTKPHIRPLGDQVVVLPVYEEAKAGERMSAGGVALPDTAENEPIEGIVVALGAGYVEGCPTCEPQGKAHVFELKVGDRVLFPTWKCLSVTLDDKEYFVLSERDVAGICV